MHFGFFDGLGGVVWTMRRLGLLVLVWSWGLGGGLAVVFWSSYVGPAVVLSRRLDPRDSLEEGSRGFGCPSGGKDGRTSPPFGLDQAC